MRKIKIKKGRGKYRTIYIPTPYEKKLLNHTKEELEWIYVNYFRSYTGIYKHVHGFIPGRSCVTNAIPHIGFKYTLSFDIENFFDSITQKMLSRYVPLHLLRSTLIDGRVPQGLPTSPILSNIAMLPVDNFIQHVGLHCLVTRYADDITISANDSEALLIGSNKLIFKLQECGFNINKSKTKLQKSAGGRRIITGVSVGEHDIRPTRKTRRKLRAAEHQGNLGSSHGLKSWMHSIENPNPNPFNFKFVARYAKNRIVTDFDTTQKTRSMKTALAVATNKKIQKIVRSL